MPLMEVAALEAGQSLLLTKNRPSIFVLIAVYIFYFQCIVLLHVESEKNAVSLLDNVVLALTTEKALGLGLLLASRTDKVVITDRLSSYEAALEI